MRLYKVITRDSVYYGRIGAAITEARAKKNYGNINGREDDWYDHWDILLDFSGNPLKGVGIGYLSNEVERVDKDAVAEKPHWKKGTLRAKV
jgi:hypothetical protein